MAASLSGKHILYDVSLVVNSVDLSDHVESITLEVGTNKQAAAAMGDLWEYDMAGTLVLNSIQATFYNDFASAKVYATLSAAFVARNTFSVVAKGTSGAKAVTNPEFTITCFVEKMPLLSGKHGERHMAPVSFGAASSLAIATS